MTPIENSGTGTNFTSKAGKIGYRLMNDLNLKDFQAAAILGNLAWESGGNLSPCIREITKGAGNAGGCCWPVGTTRKGYGWAQWTNGKPGGRMDKFVDFCKTNFNVDITKQAATDDMNYQYLVYELKNNILGNILDRGSSYVSNGERFRWVGLRNTKTIDEAVVDFMNSFERPANTARHEANRKNLAYQALQAMNGSSPPINSTAKNQTVTK